MGKLLLNAQVIINSVDLTDHCYSVTVNGQAADEETTGMGAQGKSRMPGLKDESFEFEWRQDFAAGKVDATLQPLYAAGTAVSVEVRPAIAARSVTNPAYVGATCYLLDYDPIAGQVAKTLNTKSKFVVDGQTAAVQRLTS
jgi:hypothetical protein